MKKFLSWLGCTICAILLATAGATALLSCEGGPKLLKATPDTEAVKACVDSIVNPTFTTTSDVFELQKTLKTNAFIDSVFLSLPPNVLKNVSTIVLKKIHHATKDDIVGEFLQNRSIYENLPPPDSTSNVASSTSTTTTTPTAIPGVVHEETTTVTEAPPTRAVENEPAGSYKDTTINGRKALIMAQ